MRVALPAAVATLALLIHVPNFPVGKSLQEDAGVFLYAARTILDGGVPYRDVWDHKAPLLYYLDALGLLLGGTSFVGVWGLQALAHAAAAVLSLRVLTRGFGTWPGLVGTAAWLLAAPRVFLFEGAFANFHQAFLAPLQLAALALFLAEERQRARTWRTYALGALAGVAALVTPAGLGLFGAIAIHLVGSRVRRYAFGAALRRAGALAAGAVAPVVVAAAALALAGALPDALDQAIAYNAGYTRAATFESRLASLVYGLRLLGSSGALALAGAGAFAAVRWRGLLPRASDARRAIDVALIAAPLELLFGSSSGRPHEYYWLAALPTIGILSAYALSAAAQRLAPAAARLTRQRADRVVVATVVAVIVALAIRPALFGAGRFASREDGTNAVAARYVRENTAPGDTLFIWGSRAAVYVLADRDAASRFVFTYAPLSSKGYHNAANADELVRAIRDRPPALILDASGSSPVTPPLDPRLATFDTHDPFFVFDPAVLKVFEAVNELYERAGTVPAVDWPVWRPKARQ